MSPSASRAGGPRTQGAPRRPGASVAGSWPGGSGTSVPPEAADASTTTARLTVTPRWRPSASLIGRRRIRSMASFANSLGAARSAVPSMSPSGRVSRRNARCCGDIGVDGDPLDVPERSAMTLFQTCPRSPGWSATGRHPPPVVALRSACPQTCPQLCARPYAGAPRVQWAARGLDRRGSPRIQRWTRTLAIGAHRHKTPSPPPTRARGGLTLLFAAAYPGQEACPFSGRHLSDPSEMTTGGPVRRSSTRRADQ